MLWIVCAGLTKRFCDYIKFGLFDPYGKTDSNVAFLLMWPLHISYFALFYSLCLVFYTSTKFWNFVSGSR